MPGRLAIAFVLASSAAHATPAGSLRGRVFERGSIVPLAGAAVNTSTGESATTDENGRFALTLPAGEIEIAVSASNHETLRLRETISPGSGLEVEYRLLPLAEHKRRYESTVRGTARRENERFALEGEELRTLPGALGDPLRTVSLLPGVAAPITLFPVFVIRGATPGMNGFFLDGLRLPQLFHLLAGGGVVHPRLVERIDYFPGSYDASFGRFAGGIIDAETRGARRNGHHFDAQLRLFDVSAAAELALPRDVGVTLSATYGWPGSFLRLFSPGTEAQYADYQARIDWRGLTLQGFGSYDSLSLRRPEIEDSSSPANQFVLTFHRLQLRYRAKRGRAVFEAAIFGGYDDLRSFSGNGVTKLAVGWRALAATRFSRVQLEVGTDGELSRFRGSRFERLTPQSPESLGALVGDRDGVIAGAYAVLHAELWPRRVFATVSVRADVYRAGGVTLVGLDPRGSLRVQLLPQLSVKVAGGVYHQPPTFPVALPGLDTFALELGLQTAYHSSVAVEAALPGGFSLSLAGYQQWFRNIIDSTLDFSDFLGCSADPPEALKGVPARILRQVDGQAYGGELLLRRQRGVVTGWIAYTLMRSERLLPCGIRPADYDQTHTLNVVVQARLPRGVLLGGRLLVASGRPATRFQVGLDDETPRNNWRMPTFVELDVRLDREWIFRKWALAGFVEILNLTYSESAFGVDYPMGVPGIIRYDQPRVIGLRWVLPSLGLRGRF